MPWSGSAGSKTFSRTDGTRTGSTTWQQADAASVDIVSNHHDTHDQDIADGLNTSLQKDGGNTATANIPMGGFTFTNIAAATARTMPARFSDLQDGKGIYVPTVSGTNTIVLTTGYTVTAYAAGQRFTFIVGTTNTGATTVNVDGLGAKSVVRSDGSHTALAAGDLVSGALADIEYDGTRFHLMTANAAGTSGDVLARIVKVGSVLPWPMTTVPSGWLEADGSAISRTTYAELFAVYGTAYGVGDGSTTFNIPNYKDYFLRGFDASGTDAAARTDRGDGTTGASVGTKQAAETAAHVHTQTAQQPTFTYSTNSANWSAGGNATITAIAATGLSSTLTPTADATPGDTASTGGTETRSKNITVKWIILALPAAASASSLGVNGFLYNWDTGTTDADPGAGKLRVNHATLASATQLYINETGANSESLASILATWDDSTSTVKGNLYVYKVGAPGTYAYYQVTGSITDAGSYDKFSLTYVANAGTLANGDNVTVLFIRNGDLGTTGAAGTAGDLRWLFDSTTSMADPGSGDIRLNNATLSSVTAAAVSDLCAESGNPDVSAYVLVWDDSATTTNRGTLIIKKEGAAQNFAIYSITGASTDNSGWTQLALTYVTHSGSFSNGDTLVLDFSRTGDLGSIGGSTGANDNRILRADGAGGSTVQSSSVTMDDSGVISGATLTAPRIADAGFIADANGNELLICTTTASAVNELTLANGATGVSPKLTASGETNVGMDFQAKGTGVYRFLSTASQAAEVRLFEDTDDGTNYVAIKPAAMGTSYTLTLPPDDGSSGEVLRTDGSGVLTWVAAAGGGDVTAASNFGTDNVLVRADGVNKGVQSTGISVDDSNNVTGVVALAATTIELGHASDTTLARTGAGVIAVEGVEVALNSTSAVHTAGTIELGAASDTTLSRSAAGVIAVEGVPIYSNIPQNSQSAAYTTVLADAQKHILHPTADNNARTFTIDANATVAYPIGTAITFVNQINTVTISITSDTLTMYPGGATGSRTLAANGMATALKVASTSWVISGVGLT